MLKLHASVSKKVGLPNFSSTSASCSIEAELDGSLLSDSEGFQIVVKRAYQSCEKAVEDQIVRLLDQENPTPRNLDGAQDSNHTQITNGLQTRSQRPSRACQPVAHEVIEARTSPAISGARITTTGDSLSSPRPATVSQVRAIRAICGRRKIDLVCLLRDKFGLTTADALGIRAASNLIDELKGDEPTNGHTSGTTHGNGNGNGYANGNGAYAAAAVNGGAR